MPHGITSNMRQACPKANCVFKRITLTSLISKSSQYIIPRIQNYMRIHIGMAISVMRSLGAYMTCAMTMSIVIDLARTVKPAAAISASLALRVPV